MSSDSVALHYMVMLSVSLRYNTYVRRNMAWATFYDVTPWAEEETARWLIMYWAPTTLIRRLKAA